MIARQVSQYEENAAGMEAFSAFARVLGTRLRGCGSAWPRRAWSGRADRGPWARVEVLWYGGTPKTLEWVTGTALWHTPGQDPVPLRWLLVREATTTAADAAPAARLEPGAWCCSDPEVTPAQLLAWFLGRWNIEVTFAALRAHLGFETQRQWSAAALGRTTPCLCGLFSRAVLLALRLHPEMLPLQQSGWYAKEEATFSDVLAVVRAHLWGRGNSVRSRTGPDWCLIPRALLTALQQVACHTT